MMIIDPQEVEQYMELNQNHADQTAIDLETSGTDTDPANIRSSTTEDPHCSSVSVRDNSSCESPSISNQTT